MPTLKITPSDARNLIRIFLRKVGIFIAFIFMLYFDGTHFSENVTDSQVFINMLALASIILMYKRATSRVRELMIYAVIVGLIGEYFFSVFLGMYTYRLENVPWYVPLGHAALYGRVFIFSKDPLVRKYHKGIEKFFSIIIGFFGVFYLIIFKDVFGFLMTIGVFVILYFRPKDRLYFYTMYIIVALLEIGGTTFGAWKWPPAAFGVFDFLPSHNPPSGISLFYFLLDVSCFFIYVIIHKKAWKRLQKWSLVAK